MKIQLLHPNAKMPTLATPGSIGYDIEMPEGGVTSHSGIPGKLHGLGFAIECPDEYAVILQVRSGAGAKRGLFLRNGFALIDRDYRGELMVSLGCHDSYFAWNPGDKLIQMILLRSDQPALRQVETLSKTARGAGGFGHTGGYGK